VPQSALVLRDGRAYLFAVNALKKADNSNIYSVEKVSVTTGRRLGDSVEIKEGLKGTPAIVKTGGAFLNDGDLVKVITTATEVK
jgi:multidrug efflux pump subunit AcrA (membrane-fusion protein)